jgi:hypothetical protein
MMVDHESLLNVARAYESTKATLQIQDIETFVHESIYTLACSGARQSPEPGLRDALLMGEGERIMLHPA